MEKYDDDMWSRYGLVVMKILLVEFTVLWVLWMLYVAKVLL